MTGSTARAISGRIEGLQLIGFIKLANKLVINEIGRKNLQHARIIDRHYRTHLCQGAIEG